MKQIDWSKQHCGVHMAPLSAVREFMPDVADLIDDSFPENSEDFTWDIKVHMLMPLQYPCIPNWHVDAVPRVNGLQRFDLVKADLPLYLWVSGPPLTQFESGYLQPKVWHRYSQNDKHRGISASDFSWRGLIRATHKDIEKPKTGDYLRRHSQVYLDAATYLC